MRSFVPGGIEATVALMAANASNSKVQLQAIGMFATLAYCNALCAHMLALLPTVIATMARFSTIVKIQVFACLFVSKVVATPGCSPDLILSTDTIATIGSFMSRAMKTSSLEGMREAADALKACASLDSRCMAAVAKISSQLG